MPTSPSNPAPDSGSHGASPLSAPAPPLVVVGGGLAGCEAAWQAAERGARVVLYEMKPERRSPAHGSDGLAELVCSNSFRAASLTNAVGLLKEEMRRLGSLVLQAADAHAVPAGRALAVDREGFSRAMTEAVEAHPRIEVRRERLAKIPEGGCVVLATGPLTDPELAGELQKLLGDEYLYFYDAIAPIVYADSVDYDVVFRASRWEQLDAIEAGEDGERGDYLNVPLTRDEYEGFVAALLEADTVPLHSFEADLYFEGCLPIEEMARRGRDTLAFGPMKPVGLVDPRTGRRPHAVVQLRQEDPAGVLFNLVGFQTKMRIGAQKEILRSLPGLGEAVFARFGSVHRNTYVNAPMRLRPDLQTHAREGLFLAGQMAGVEGYVESAALGLLVGIHAERRLRGEDALQPPPESAHGALINHLMNANAKRFQPMNVNFGLFPALARPEGGGKRVPKREKNQKLADRALEAIDAYARAVGVPEDGVLEHAGLVE